MHQFSTREYYFNIHPMIEILVDNQPWGLVFPYDEHFKFGTKKARLILASLDLISDFVESDGLRPKYNKVISIFDDELGIRCDCTTYPGFKIKGIYRPYPYMKIESEQTNIGFGLTKAEALLVVERRIEAFVKRHG